MMQETNKLWVVKSNRKEVLPPIERQIISTELRYRKRFYSDKIAYINKFVLDKTELPYEVEIEDEQISYLDDRLFTGMGDCWGSSEYYSLSENDANNYYEKEKIRIEEKYLFLLK